MRPMNAFAAARLEQALYWMQNAVDHLDGAVDRIPRDCVLRAVGELTAMRQLLEMEADLLEKADTERPAPKLTVVR